MSETSGVKSSCTSRLTCTLIQHAVDVRFGNGPRLAVRGGAVVSSRAYLLIARNVPVRLRVRETQRTAACSCSVAGSAKRSEDDAFARQRANRERDGLPWRSRTYQVVIVFLK